VVAQSFPRSKQYHVSQPTRGLFRIIDYSFLLLLHPERWLVPFCCELVEPIPNPAQTKTAHSINSYWREKSEATGVRSGEVEKASASLPIRSSSAPEPRSCFELSLGAGRSSTAPLRHSHQHIHRFRIGGRPSTGVNIISHISPSIRQSPILALSGRVLSSDHSSTSSTSSTSCHLGLSCE
jgi:hypothetical protein